MATEYVVERDNWQLDHGVLIRRFGTVRVAAFPTFAAADECARRLEAEARALADPFALSDVWCQQSGSLDRLPGLAAVTHFPEWAFLDWLQDHDVPVPPAGADGRRDWPEWWRAGLEAAGPKRLLPSRRAAVWDALTKVRFHRVTEQPAGPPVSAVLGLRWEWGSYAQYQVAEREGGELLAVHGTRRAAEADAVRRTADFLTGASSVSGFSMYGRPFPGWPFFAPDPPAAWPLPQPRPIDPHDRDIRDVPHFEACEVGAAPGVADRGVLVMRVAFEFGYSGRNERADPVVPVRLFPDQRSADAWAAAAEAEARREWPVAWYGELDQDRWDDPAVPADVAAALDLLGLPPLPPAAEYQHSSEPVHSRLRRWWHDHGADVTPEQNAELWAMVGAPTPRFYSTRTVLVQ